MAENGEKPEGDGPFGAESAVGQLIERYRQTRGTHDQVRYAAERDLVASRHPAALTEFLRSATTYGRGVRQDERVLRGVVFRDGGGDIGFPRGNPWDVLPGTRFTEVIRRVWAPLAERAPVFVDTLIERLFAVVAVSISDRLCLAYILDDSQREYPDGWTLAEMFTDDEVTVEVVWGSPPRDVATDAYPILRGPVPEALRALCAVHDTMYSTSSTGGYFNPHTMGYSSWHSPDCPVEGFSWYENKEPAAEHEGSAVAAADTGGNDGPTSCACATRYVVVAGFNDEWDAFDLEDRDSSGEPNVVRINCNDGVSHRCYSPWGWLNDREGPVGYVFDAF